MTKPRLQSSDRVLVVEGYSDLLFYAEVAEHAGVQSLFIQHFNGISEVATALDDFITPDLLSEKLSIAVCVDADQTPHGTVQKFEALLTKITGQAVLHGKWTTGTPKIGLFVVPDGPNTQGEIETLVWTSWAADAANSAGLSCITAYEACMSGSGSTARSRHKGLIGALLAIEADEDPRLGPGAREQVFDLGRPELGPLVNFFRGF